MTIIYWYLQLLETEEKNEQYEQNEEKWRRTVRAGKIVVNVDDVKDAKLNWTLDTYWSFWNQFLWDVVDLAKDTHEITYELK